MEDFNVFIGGVSGVFKGLKASQTKGVHKVTNLQNLKDITHRNEVTVLTWADKSENEVLLGYQNQLVKIYDLNANSFCYNEERRVGEGPIRGLFKLNGSLVTGVESGLVKIWSEKETIIKTGGPLSRMRQSPVEETIMATGGKENELKLWDLETCEATFQAKNVRHDELELRVPVWVMDIAFIPNSKQVAIASRYGHIRLYDPSTPTRRPVCQLTLKDHSLTCITTAPREHHVVVGCTTGNMYLADLRGKGTLLNKYKGFMGSVRQIACAPTEPYVLSVSLDRHLRVHHLNTKKLLFREYLQSRLSSLLLKSTFTMTDIKEEEPEIKEEIEDPVSEEEVDEEYEELFNQMEVISEKENRLKIKGKRKKFENGGDNGFPPDDDELRLDGKQTSKKKTKSKLNSKRKRLKCPDEEIVIE